MTSSSPSAARRLPARRTRDESRPRGRGRLGCCWLGAFLLPALAACGEDEGRPAPLGTGRPVPGCERFAYRTCDILSSACQSELFSLAACLYGVDDPGAPPPVRRLDEASAIALILDPSSPTAMTEGIDAMSDMGADEDAFRAEVRGLELIGLLDPGLIESPADVAGATVDSLLAYYLIPTREIVIIDRGERVDDLEANGVLAHEFLHALQDRRHDLLSFGAELELDSDGYLARSSLIEGEASIYQYLILFAYQGANVRSVNFDAFFEELTSAGMQVTIATGSPALTADSIFPYTYGTRYAGERWVAGGSAGLDAAYGAPPRTSWEVLARQASPGFATFGEAPAPLEGYAAVMDDAAGAWVSVAMLAGLSGASEIGGELETLASGWRGDHFWIFASPEAGVATLWALEWESEEAAARFAELAAALEPEGVTLRIDTAESSTRLVAVERAEDLEVWRERLAEAVP